MYNTILLLVSGLLTIKSLTKACSKELYRSGRVERLESNFNKI